MKKPTKRRRVKKNWMMSEAIYRFYDNKAHEMDTNDLSYTKEKDTRFVKWVAWFFLGRFAEKIKIDASQIKFIHK